MRILIATDAWHPQVNGVVRTLTSLARAAATLGAEIEFLTPQGFPSMGVPTYPGLRVALPKGGEIARRIEAAAPEAVHIATEGPIGWWVRAYCRRHPSAIFSVPPCSTPGGRCRGSLPGPSRLPAVGLTPSSRN